MRATITLKQISCGTELNIVQEGLPEVIPLEMCYLGWQEAQDARGIWTGNDTGRPALDSPGPS